MLLPTIRSQFLYRRKQVGDLKQNDRTVRFDSFSLVIHLLLIKPMHFIFNTQDMPFKRKWGHLTSVPWKPSTFLTDDRKSGSLTGNGHDNGKEMTRVPGSCADKGSLSSKLGQSKKCHLWQKASKDFFTFIFKAENHSSDVSTQHWNEMKYCMIMLYTNFQIFYLFYF